MMDVPIRRFACACTHVAFEERCLATVLTIARALIEDGRIHTGINMWGWEQGRLEYFQFDTLRKIARSGGLTDLRQVSRADLAATVGLPFLPDDPRYRPWRNYGRLFQISMIAVPRGPNHSELTVVGDILSQDGRMTADEYLHFLARATTDPSPASSAWDHSAKLRYPLLFVLRFALARAAEGMVNTSILGVVRAYETYDFVGNESNEDFLEIIQTDDVAHSPHRQANESIKVLAQLSYLTATRDEITVSLASSDARDLFCGLVPLQGVPLRDRTEELLRRARLFPSANVESSFSYPASIISNVGEAGFVFKEGARVRQSHLTIERNRNIRNGFFKKNPDQICDLCGMNTCKHYPWTSKLLEVHHLLPLCSGARTSHDGTVLEDLVANCPTCHRAVHRYYDHWLEQKSRVDFVDAHEARDVYEEAKSHHQNAVAQ